MRVPPLAALAVLLCAGGAGCIEASSSASDRDCTSANHSIVAARSDLLLPAAATDASGNPFGGEARVTVLARAGQTLTAVATWQVQGGEAQVVFDGPDGDEVRTGGTWTHQSEASSDGRYTLQLEGAPLAMGVAYTLYLDASGCTPA